MPNKLSINLLPPELKEVKKDKDKHQRVNQISIGVLVFVIIAASIVLLLKFNEKNELNKANNQLEQLKTTLSDTDHKQKEELLTALQARIQSISQIRDKDEPPFYAYGMFTQLAGENTRINSLTVNNKGKVDITVSSNDTPSLDSFFNNLETPNLAQGAVSNVVITSLGQNSTSKVYNVELLMNLNGKSQ